MGSDWCRSTSRTEAPRLLTLAEKAAVYAIRSSTASKLYLAGRVIPEGSVVYECTAIGYTDHAVESSLPAAQARKPTSAT
jgi:hypothetical protein